jgi:hypothetical protein
MVQNHLDGVAEVFKSGYDTAYFEGDQAMRNLT